MSTDTKTTESDTAQVVADDTLAATLDDNSGTDGLEPMFFETMTQYDKSFDDLWVTNPEAKKGLACPYFSIFAAQEFMNTTKCDQATHEVTLRSAITANVLLATNDEMTFETLVSYTDLNPKDIGCTTAGLLAANEYDLKDEVFNSDCDKYAVIFLKNAKFFAVLVDDTGFHTRDAHESVQFDFYTLDQLMEHLEKTYQFKSNINVGGVSYDDYGSIEFLKITKPFNNVLNNLIESKLEDQEVETKLEFEEMKNDSAVDDSTEQLLIQQALMASMENKPKSTYEDFNLDNVVDGDSDDSSLISDTDDDED